MASNFSEKFPKPAECESPTRILRWESRREGYLAALKETKEKYEEITLSDRPMLFGNWIRQEIKAVEESK